MRFAQALSQLARLVGVSQQALSAYECGRPCPPDLVVSLARALRDKRLVDDYCASCQVRRAGVA